MLPRLLLLFILVPLVEFYLFMTIGAKIGIGATIGIIILTGILGAYLAKQQGLKALMNFQKATAEGRMPHEEIMDGLMILIAGAVLLTPGFLTDAFGFAMLIPPVRAVVRKLIGKSVKTRIQVVGMPGMQTPEGQSRQNIGDDVVIEAEAEVIDEPTNSKQ